MIQEVANATGYSSNKYGFFHTVKSFVSFFSNLTISDLHIINNKIYIELNHLATMRIHHNKSKAEYFLPKDILESTFINHLNISEKKLIYLCREYNMYILMNNVKKTYDKIKIDIGDTLVVKFISINNDEDSLIFKIDIKKLHGLVRKYKSLVEAEKILINIVYDRR